jgi:hypothetical protein
MEILRIGSFVNLDNREKIEQLKITAYELANAASQTEGFVNSPESNRKLALEVWQGAEYMCRGHEEATIKNIFLSNFLEKLREVGMETPVQLQVGEPIPPADSHVPSINADAVPQASCSLASDFATGVATPKDEYLGVVASNENQDSVQTRSYSDECVPESETDIKSIVDKAVSGVEEAASTNSQDLVSSEIAISEVVNSESSSTEITPTGQETDRSTVGPIESIVLKGKEPYNFDSCTVTAVIQLLPENAGRRKCIVSIRTHDFTPQIAISELRTGQMLQDIFGALDDAFEQYRTDLPIRAADKIKKEKPANTNRSAKSNSSPKPSIPSTGGDKSEGARLTTEPTLTVHGANTEKDQQNLFGA